jgi:hypothetical protein
MKVLFLLLGGSLLLAGTAHAQAGVRVGGNLSGFKNTTSNGYRTTTSSQLGFQAGIYYQVPLGKRLALVPEVQYSNERLNISQSSAYISGGQLNIALQGRYNYLNVPVLLRLNIGPVYLEAGPQASVLLGSQETGYLVTSSTGTPNSINRDLPNYYQRFDVGPSAGVGIRLPGGLGLNVRAYQGLVSVNGDGNGLGNFHRQSVQASLTFQLPQ